RCASALQRDCVRGKQTEERHAEIRHASGLAVGQDRDDAGGSGRAARLPRRSAMENVRRRAAGLEDRRKVSALRHASVFQAASKRISSYARILYLAKPALAL